MQEQQKYQRVSGINFGSINFKAYVEALGATDFAVESSDQLEFILKMAMTIQGLTVAAIPVDFSDNPRLMEQLHLSQFM